MASAFPGEAAARPPVGALLESRIADKGSAAHSWCVSEALLSGADSARNLADAVHFLSTLHGRQPSVIDLAAERTIEPPARAWLELSADAFAVERAFLARLAVEVGPVPGTPGGGQSEAAVVSQRTALATLGRSERRGCALGAALGLVGDWAVVRRVLDTAARRFGFEAPRATLPGASEVRALAEELAGNGAFERALLFGAEQILVQHHGLWSLLQARAEARRL